MLYEVLNLCLAHRINVWIFEKVSTKWKFDSINRRYIGKLHMILVLSYSWLTLTVDYKTYGLNKNEYHFEQVYMLNYGFLWKKQLLTITIYKPLYSCYILSCENRANILKVLMSLLALLHYYSGVIFMDIFHVDLSLLSEHSIIDFLYLFVAISINLQWK